MTDFITHGLLHYVIGVGKNSSVIGVGKDSGVMRVGSLISFHGMTCKIP